MLFRSTNELIDAALDWAVTQIVYEGTAFDVWRNFRNECRYSTDWSQGGPIIEREKLTTDFFPDGCSKYGCEWTVQAWDEHGNCYAAEMGETILIAAMRCYVALKLGNEVEIPEELK